MRRARRADRRALGSQKRVGAQAAADALRGYDDPQIMESLLVATHDVSPKVRAQAAVSLGFGRIRASGIQSSKAYSRLLAMLTDETPEVRESAINGLRWLGNAEAIPAIKKLQADDPDEKVRQMARRTVEELSHRHQPGGGGVGGWQE